MTKSNDKNKKKVSFKKDVEIIGMLNNKESCFGPVRPSFCCNHWEENSSIKYQREYPQSKPFKKIFLHQQHKKWYNKTLMEANDIDMYKRETCSNDYRTKKEL
jgi:hypothetical protein